MNDLKTEEIKGINLEELSKIIKEVFEIKSTKLTLIDKDQYEKKKFF
jgi:hypothetical protein